MHELHEMVDTTEAETVNTTTEGSEQGGDKIRLFTSWRRLLVLSLACIDCFEFDDLFLHDHKTTLFCRTINFQIALHI